MKSTPIIIVIIIAASLTFANETQTDRTYEMLQSMKDPEKQSIVRPEKTIGLKMFGKPAAISIIERSGYTRYTVFVYEDGSVIWRDDYAQKSFDPIENPAGIREENDNTEERTILYSRFNIGFVPEEKVADLLEKLKSKNICEDPGYQFLLPLDTKVTEVSVTNEDCVFQVSSPLKYLDSNFILTPTGKKNVTEQSKTSTLESEHQRVRQIYETHDLIIDEVDKLITEANNNGYKSDLGYVELDWYPIE